jgi:hypothetical protein
VKTSTSFSPKGEDLSDWITQAEAARIRGCKQQAIFNLVSRGKLETLEIGGKIFVRRSQVEKYVRERGGRPKKKTGPKKKKEKKKVDDKRDNESN